MIKKPRGVVADPRGQVGKKQMEVELHKVQKANFSASVKASELPVCVAIISEDILILQPHNPFGYMTAALRLMKDSFLRTLSQRASVASEVSLLEMDYNEAAEEAREKARDGNRSKTLEADAAALNTALNTRRADLARIDRTVRTRYERAVACCVCVDLFGLAETSARFGAYHALGAVMKLRQLMWAVVEKFEPKAGVSIVACENSRHWVLCHDAESGLKLATLLLDLCQAWNERPEVRSDRSLHLEVDIGLDIGRVVVVPGDSVYGDAAHTASFLARGFDPAKGELNLSKRVHKALRYSPALQGRTHRKKIPAPGPLPTPEEVKAAQRRDEAQEEIYRHWERLVYTEQEVIFDTETDDPEDKKQRNEEREDTAAEDDEDEDAQGNRKGSSHKGSSHKGANQPSVAATTTTTTNNSSNNNNNNPLAETLVYYSVTMRPLEIPAKDPRRQAVEVSGSPRLSEFENLCLAQFAPGVDVAAVRMAIHRRHAIEGVLLVTALQRPGGKDPRAPKGLGSFLGLVALFRRRLHALVADHDGALLVTTLNTAYVLFETVDAALRYALEASAAFKDLVPGLRLAHAIGAGPVVIVPGGTRLAGLSVYGPILDALLQLVHATSSFPAAARDDNQKDASGKRDQGGAREAGVRAAVAIAPGAIRLTRFAHDRVKDLPMLSFEPGLFASQSSVHQIEAYTLMSCTGEIHRRGVIAFGGKDPLHGPHQGKDHHARHHVPSGHNTMHMHGEDADVPMYADVPPSRPLHSRRRKSRQSRPSTESRRSLPAKGRVKPSLDHDHDDDHDDDVGRNEAHDDDDDDDVHGSKEGSMGSMGKPRARSALAAHGSHRTLNASTMSIHDDQQQQSNQQQSNQQQSNQQQQQNHHQTNRVRSAQTVRSVKEQQRKQQEQDQHDKDGNKDEDEYTYEYYTTDEEEAGKQ